MKHGDSLSLTSIVSGDTRLVLAAALPNNAPVFLHDFGYLFPSEASNPSTRLPDGPATRQHLIDLGMSLADPGGNLESIVPAAYTYFGQFVDHDITLDAASDAIRKGIIDVVAALTPAQILTEIKNTRTGTFDLDSVYEDTPRDPSNADLMLIGQVTDVGARPPGKTDDNDLPREPVPPLSAARPGQARIGDPRNDENVIVSQLHLAFLKAHNALVANHGMKFDGARMALRQHYQWIVLHDFLPRICDAATLQTVVGNGPTLFPGTRNFMPLEFSVCAYRFGHTMVRNRYDFNNIFPDATLAQLFQFTELSGIVGKSPGLPTLPSNWIIEWDRLIDRTGTGQRTRAFDTVLAPELLNIPLGSTDPALNNLAVRNLLRGFLLSMPTGQAVAAALHTPALTPTEIVGNAKTPQEATALTDAGFDSGTPLWYYVLAEASIVGKGNSLGPVGSRIVAETFIRFLTESADSILGAPGWTPTLPSSTSNTFTLADLLTLAGV
jgi:hypothetical protein